MQCNLNNIVKAGKINQVFKLKQFQYTNKKLKLVENISVKNIILLG